MIKDNNIHKDYSSYTVDELLQDDFFLSSMKYPTSESEDFWNRQLNKGIINKQDYELARFFINSVQVQPELIFQDEIYELWENIEVSNKKNLKSKRSKFRFLYIVATSAVAVIALTFLLFFGKQQSIPDKSLAQLQIEDIKRPDSETKDIQLILSDNKTLDLAGETAEVDYDEEGLKVNNEKMNLKKKTEKDQETISYNQLVVPLGKRSTLTLSEGTKIWVNAGTRIVYPTRFSSKNREIYVDGEAYLDISRDESRPFIVKTKKVNIEVLGTSFNVMAYEHDDTQSIVLVSGSIKVNDENQKTTLLKPNHMYSYENGSASIRSVNVNDYISWKSGLYQYHSENLGTILKRLSRYYGKEIICDQEAFNLKCSGKLDLKENIQDVLIGIAETAPVVFKSNGEVYKMSLKKN